MNIQNTIFTKYILPNKYMITGHYINRADFIKKLEDQIASGMKLIQVRAKNISDEEYVSLAKKCLEIGKKFDSVKILLNTKPQIAEELNADGVHLTSSALMDIKVRPLPRHKLVAAACHNLIELNKAMDLKVDFVTLSPVLHTQTHPEAQPLGWENFMKLCENYSIPVFALGGMQQHNLKLAQSYGAYGIASISWWGSVV